MAETKQPAARSQRPQLELVEPIQDQHLNVLLYGPPKVGKTVAAASAPGPLLYLNADRPNATRFAHKLHGGFDEARVTGLETLIAAMHSINEGSYRSIVVDPVGETYMRILEGISGSALRPAIQLRGDTSTHLERFCRALCDAPINVVFVCHELPTKDEESGVIERQPYTGTNNPAFGQKLMAMVDAVAYCGSVPIEGSDEVEYVGQLITAAGRRGGDRFGLGPTRKLDLSEWTRHVAGVLESEKKKDAQKGAAA